MALLVNVEIGDKIRETHIIEEMTDNEIRIAMNKFNDMKEAGNLEGNFDDNIWYVNNEIIRRGINFEFNEIQVRKQSILSYKEFVNLVKYYICLRFGSDTIHVLPKFASNLKKAVNETNCFTILPQNIKCLQQDGVPEFLSFLPWKTEKFQFLKEYDDQSLYRKRTLAEYQSYFLFNDIMNEFWDSASIEEQNYFYPLYLWWNITMILPLRVTEFLVTPKECLIKKNEKYYLIVRRTSLKGDTSVTERYKIDKDYKKYMYEITLPIANSIMEYKKRISEFNETPIDTLFSFDFYKKSKEMLYDTEYRGRGEFNKRFTVAMLNMMLSDFYNYHIVKKKKYIVKAKRELLDVDENGIQYELKSDEIAYINLGDTRHIALQNLLINGCNLLMAKEISGHETVDMIYHYSGNIKNLVKCHAYRLHRMINNDSQSISNLSQADKLLAPRASEYVQTDSGRCYSNKMIKGNPEDCYKVGGDCEICIYYDGMHDTEKYEQDFDDKIARIKIWITSKNKLKDKEEAAVLSEKMATATSNLAMMYYKEKEGNINGKSGKTN